MLIKLKCRPVDGKISAVAFRLLLSFYETLIVVLLPTFNLWNLRLHIGQVLDSSAHFKIQVLQKACLQVGMKAFSLSRISSQQITHPLWS